MTDETAPVATAPAVAVPTDIPAPALVVAPAPPAAPAAAPAAPGPDVVVPSAAAAPVPAAPAPVGGVPTGAAGPAATPTQVAVANLAAAVNAPVSLNHCAAMHATIRAWEVAKFSAVLAVVGTWSFAKCINNLITGFRTLIVLGVTFSLGLGDSLGGLDITGFITAHYPNVKVGDVMIAMTVLSFCLRAITKTPMFQSWKTGRTLGSVDEPN